MKRGLIMLLAGGLLAVSSAGAMARDNVSFSISIGTPAYVHVPAVVYHEPPVYYVPAHVYYHPAPPPRVVHVTRGPVVVHHVRDHHRGRGWQGPPGHVKHARWNR